MKDLFFLIFVLRRPKFDLYCQNKKSIAFVCAIFFRRYRKAYSVVNVHAMSQPYWQPHNRAVARRIQNMGWRADGGLWLLVRGGGLYLSKGTGVNFIDSGYICYYYPKHIY